MNSPRLIRLPEVQRITGASRALVYKLMAAGDFPQSVKLGGRAVAWDQGEVEAWVEERKQERNVA